ncbi:MAG TPA: gluconeogenesis factor YvcK family protein [Thermoanaerobaculia bacterium]|nr:gluconeogenesis factor YvcK family protein [Thermoanaerobaculia bacterium]
MLKNRTHIVGIGGGTGLSILLVGLKRQLARSRHDPRARPADISAIVSVADDGGSSGLLRQSFDIPAVGDLRNCIVALAQGNQMWSRLFQHRFEGDNGLSGHALGNLIMTALVQRAGGLTAAISQLGRALRLRGRVFPMSEDRVALHAECEDGVVVRGESQIPLAGRRIAKVWLEPARPVPAPGVLDALASADAIVLGPGSLYTSILPNLLVEGVAKTIRESKGLRIFVCNLMTQPGETAGFDALDHVRVVEGYLGKGAIDICVINGRSVPAPAATLYAATGAEEVRWSSAALARAGTLPIVADLLMPDQFPNRHDSERLADVVLCLARGLHRRRRGEVLEVAAAPAAAEPPLTWGPRELQILAESP